VARPDLRLWVYLRHLPSASRLAPLYIVYTFYIVYTVYKYLQKYFPAFPAKALPVKGLSNRRVCECLGRD